MFDERVKRLRKELRELAEAADPRSVGDQIELATISQQLWLALEDECLKQAEEDEKRSTEFLALAAKCSSEAKDWSHQARQAQKLVKVDLLRDIERRLDEQEMQAQAFAAFAEDRAKHRRANVRARLKRARGEPAGIRGGTPDRESGEPSGTAATDLRVADVGGVAAVDG